MKALQLEVSSAVLARDVIMNLAKVPPEPELAATDKRS